ncbi:MAG: GGDEF domain-containing protein [Bacilli bacterium]|nr:GGDEF domain-containing protein [Bacilli bacterium]
MITIFAIYGVLPLLIYNILSIAFYVFMPFLIHRKKLTLFVLLTYFEINIHMGLAVPMVGWDSGFQFTLLGIVVFLFYCEYIGRTLKLKTIPSLYLIPAPILIYLAVYIISVNVTPPYPLPKGINIAFQVTWWLVVFSILAYILQTFISVVLRSQRELSNEALHDKLTGLPNRYYMSHFFTSALDAKESIKRYIAIIDIDDFKAINDSCGHNCGDAILKTVADLFRQECPEAEICRWGGEEFLIGGMAPKEDPIAMLEHLRLAVEQAHIPYEGKEHSVTITIGFAWYEPKQGIDEWVEAADKKLYEGKNSGKNRLVY